MKRSVPTLPPATNCHYDLYVDFSEIDKPDITNAFQSDFNPLDHPVCGWPVSTWKDHWLV